MLRAPIHPPAAAELVGPVPDFDRTTGEKLRRIIHRKVEPTRLNNRNPRPINNRATWFWDKVNKDPRLSTQPGPFPEDPRRRHSAPLFKVGHCVVTVVSEQLGQLYLGQSGFLT